MKTKHTPGPWHTEGDGIIYGPNPDFDPKDLQSNPDIMIADTAPDTANLMEQDQDNAILIAAAPELLDALKALRKWLVEATERELDHQTLDDALVWAKNITQSAITKATTRKDK